MTMISSRENVCETQRDTMEGFFAETLSEMELRHFLNHVARCNKCLDYILAIKAEIKEKNETMESKKEKVLG